MKTVLVTMTGVGFTLGVVFGLLLQLPIDNTLSADSTQDHNNPLSNTLTFRSRRSLSEEILRQQQQQQDQQFHVTSPSTHSSQHILFFVPNIENGNLTLVEEKLAGAKSNSFIRPRSDGFISKIAPIQAPRETKQRSTGSAEESLLNEKTGIFNLEEKFHKDKTTSLDLERELHRTDAGISDHKDIKLNSRSNVSSIVRVKLNLQTPSFLMKDKLEILKRQNTYSPEDASYMTSIVKGVLWTLQLEKSCPIPFKHAEAQAWRKRVEGLDVVKMDEGCGRMQNRLLTFRDASKACVRYRLNTDQIQGEIYSYYLARLFNMSNIPPTMLAQVNSLSSMWKTVHLKLSLAQWADSKLVVLTEHIDGLSPAHIPIEFREEGRRLEPTLKNLGSKSHSELCELVQWSDLIVFDYLTANLDRVINNMFNRQWNDQMMSSPAHNLEQRPDGGLVFLDNESGLFHGYRLLDKYSGFHQSLLHGLCVFRESTANTVKKLHKSSSIGEELHKLFASSEVLHKQLPAITGKNVKILQQRLSDVYQQITQCERLFNR